MKIRLLFIGDVVDTVGCEFLKSRLSQFKRENRIDVCAVNGENAARGNGATPESCNMLFNAGADLITLGNHAFRRPEIADYLDSREDVIRPYNYPDGAPGSGAAVIDKGRFRLAVINLQGTSFGEPLGNPFEYADRALECAGGCKCTVVDFHAEATGEKRALGFYLNGRVSAVIGTHTHVQTADEQILDGGTAYITDVGMTGAVNSVLGVKPEAVIKKLKTNLPVKFEAAGGEQMMNACIVEIDSVTGKAESIERVALK